MNKRLLFILLCAFYLQTQAQDTLTVMQYNMLNYGNYTSYCTPANNNHEDKDVLLNTILDYVAPHIFTVNEMSQYEFYHDRILNEVLNTNGKNYYRRAETTNTAGSYIINGLYYDVRMLTLHSQFVAQSDVRDINVYKLYYKHASLAQGDTTFIHCIVAHLKSSTGTVNVEKRAAMVSNTMNWLKNKMSPGNYLVMGDFNVYKSSEPAYQLFTNPDPSYQAFTFYDPVDQPGNWHENATFANIHTQSVAVSGNGCQAGGGMDDRFDFILASEKIMQGTENIRYISETYKALGQDGLHYNKSITDTPQNTSVPTDVLIALGTHSDHLPVVMKLLIRGGPTGINHALTNLNTAEIRYSVNEHYLHINSGKDQQIQTSIIDLTGKVINTGVFYLSSGNNTLKLPTDHLSRGMYLLRITEANGGNLTLKLIR